MNMKINTLILLMCLLILNGCGLVKDKSVPQKQIESDIERQPLKVKVPNGTIEWDFNPTDFKPLSCFAINRDESKVTISNADLSVTVASWKKRNRLDSDTMVETWYFYTLYGKVLMNYKKEGDKWVLEKLEPQDFTYEKPTNSEDFIKFVEKGTRLCAKSS